VAARTSGETPPAACFRTSSGFSTASRLAFGTLKLLPFCPNLKLAHKRGSEQLFGCVFSDRLDHRLAQVMLETLFQDPFLSRDSFVTRMF